MKQDTITATETARLLLLTEADLRAGKCLTDKLTRVEGGYLKSEVTAHAEYLKRLRFVISEGL